jgi:hypothetical protein
VLGCEPGVVGEQVAQAVRDRLGIVDEPVDVAGEGGERGDRHPHLRRADRANLPGE